MRLFLFLWLATLGAWGQPLSGRVHIDSIPPGARVYGRTFSLNRPDVAQLGTTPCLLPVDRRSSQIYTLILPGYLPARVSLPPAAGVDSTPVLQVELEPSGLLSQLVHPFRVHPSLAYPSLALVIVLAMVPIHAYGRRLQRLEQRSREAALEIPDLVGHLVDGYRVYEKLGEGSLSCVYRVVHQEYQDEFALKWLKPGARTPSSLDRFRLEVELGAELVHPRLVRVFGFGSLSDSPYLIMELIQGPTLEQRLRRGRMPEREALELAIQACEALEFLHSRGVVHRDLKPSNLILSGDGLRVVDYGAVKASQDLTASGTALGTPLYMSPEHLNARKADGRADLYSLGVILFECLSGRPPFEGSSAAQVLAGHLYDPPPVLHRVRPAVRELVAQLLAKAPAARPDSARTTRKLLQNLLNDSESEMKADPPRRAC